MAGEFARAEEQRAEAPNEEEEKGNPPRSDGSITAPINEPEQLEGEEGEEEEKTGSVQPRREKRSRRLNARRGLMNSLLE